MKTRNVIVIATKDNEFITNLTKDVKNIPDYVYKGVDSTDDIKYAHDFDSIEDAEYALSKISNFWGGKVKRFSYEVDDKFLLEAENIIEIV
jgi:truncated hemoglobin YjbI